MPYPNEHAARLHEPSRYKRFRRENDKFGTGIHAIWGVLPSDKVELQAIRFDASRFTVAEAKKWLKEHGYKPIRFEPASAQKTAGDKESKGMGKMIELEAQALIEIEAAAEGEKAKQPTFVIDAYHGGLLRVFAFPDGIVIDLAGLRADRVTVLKDHNREQIVGQGTARITARNVTVTGIITGAYEREGTPAEEVVSHSKNGFVWAASVGVSIDRIEFVEAGEKVKVNGQTFSGPVAIARTGRLGEVSFVGIGADENASAKIAATLAREEKGAGAMDGFEKWVEGQGLKVAGLDEKQASELRVKYEAEQKGAEIAAGADEVPDGVKFGGNGTKPDAGASYLEKEAAARELIGKVTEVFGDSHPKVQAQAIREKWDEGRLKAEKQLADLRASRPTPPNIATSVPRDLGPAVIEAAMLMGAGMKVEKQYPEAVLEAAHKQYRHGLGIGRLLCVMAEAATGRRFDLQHDGVREVIRAAWSTRDVADILSNVGNKFLLQGYNYGENADLKIASIRPVKDFKTKTSYRLTGDGEFVKVAPSGSLSYGTLTDQSFTNKADTYGIVFGVPRTDIINDDLGCFDSLVPKIGQGASLSRQKAFWTEFLANESATFFASGNANVATGAPSALSMAAVTAAILLLRKMTDPDSKPINAIPWGLLVPAALEGTALTIFKSLEIRDTTASTKTLTANIYQGRFDPIVSRYLDDTSLTGASATAWYLLADPALLPTMEICFLNGVQTPTIESVDPTVEYLGIQMRGYFDFGVNMQDPRGGVRSAGA